MNKNLSLALNLVAVVVGMVLLAYASVPLYRLFCQMTGYGGTPREATQAPGQVINREIAIRFNADMDPGLPWRFKPGERVHKVKVGERSLTYYIAENLTDEPLTGQATYNVLPFKAGPYFMKIECFCFVEQTLAPRQRVNMPISFYIDPAIMNDPGMDKVETITLSYTFFPVKK